MALLNALNFEGLEVPSAYCRIGGLEWYQYDPTKLKVRVDVYASEIRYVEGYSALQTLIYELDLEDINLKKLMNKVKKTAYDSLKLIDEFKDSQDI